MNHNGTLLLGAVKTAGGREGEGWGRRKGSGGCEGSRVQRGDVDGKVKGEGREEEAKTGERGGMKPGRKKRHELGSKEEEGRMRGTGGRGTDVVSKKIRKSVVTQVQVILRGGSQDGGGGEGVGEGGFHHIF